MDRAQSDVGSRYFTGAVTVDLTRDSSLVISNREPYTVYGLKILADTVLDAASCVLARGYDCNLSALVGVTLTPGDYPIRFKTLVIASGSGFAFLEG